MPLVDPIPDCTIRTACCVAGSLKSSVVPSGRRPASAGALRQDPPDHVQLESATVLAQPVAAEHGAKAIAPLELGAPNAGHTMSAAPLRTATPSGGPQVMPGEDTATTWRLVGSKARSAPAGGVVASAP